MPRSLELTFGSLYRKVYVMRVCVRACVCVCVHWPVSTMSQNSMGVEVHNQDNKVYKQSEIQYRISIEKSFERQQELRAAMAMPCHDTSHQSHHIKR